MPPASTIKETESNTTTAEEPSKVDSKILTVSVKKQPDKSTTGIDEDSTRTSHTNKNNRNISFGRRHGQFTPYHRNSFRQSSDNESRKKANNEKFRYGNYHQYYGYRNHGTMDSRLMCMRQEFFAGKDVLDIGCNAGHFTLSVARDFSPKCIIGMDIDHDLVRMAMKNVKHYINPQDIEFSDDSFPLSLVLSYGPVAQSADPKMVYPAGKFPFNVQFVQGNYILPSDDDLELQEENFDTILCLSLTKWIHLNWGDRGIKRLFQRIYAQLRPGGHLILEAQEYKTYNRKKKINEETLKNYSEIKLYPEVFNAYLLNEVGFVSCELIDTPAHSSKGFSRPIYLFTKKENTEQKKNQLISKHVTYDDSFSSYHKDSDVEELSE